MDITSIKIDRDRGQVTLVVHDAISGLTWGVFPTLEEQGPKRERETDEDYGARLRALVEVLRSRAIAEPAPGAGKPPREPREPEELVKQVVPLTDKAAVTLLSGFKAADMAKLDAYRSEMEAAQEPEQAEVVSRG